MLRYALTLTAVMLVSATAAARSPYRELERRDDRRDARTLQVLLAEYDGARERRDRGTLRNVEQQVRYAIASELAESGQELNQARRGPRRVAFRERATLERYAQIQARFGALEGRMGRRALDEKRSLIVELVDLARAELREDGRGFGQGRRPQR